MQNYLRLQMPKPAVMNADFFFFNLHNLLKTIEMGFEKYYDLLSLRQYKNDAMD